MRRRRGLGLIELMVATSIVVILLAGVTLFQGKAAGFNRRDREASFAREKAMQLLEEIRSMRTANGGPDLTQLDAIAQTASYVLSLNAGVSSPTHALSANPAHQSGYRYVRRVTISPLSGDANARVVSIALHLSKGQASPTYLSPPLATQADILRAPTATATDVVYVTPTSGSANLHAMLSGRNFTGLTGLTIGGQNATILQVTPQCVRFKPPATLLANTSYGVVATINGVSYQGDQPFTIRNPGYYGDSNQLDGYKQYQNNAGDNGWRSKIVIAKRAGACDCEDDEVWTSAYQGGHVYRYATTGKQIGDYVMGNTFTEGLAVEPGGAAWVAVANANHVVRIAPDGTIGTPINTNNDPQGLALDANGRLWIAHNNSPDKAGYIDDAANGGTTYTQIPNGAPTYFWYSRGIALDDQGCVYFAQNWGGGQVVKLSPTGALLRRLNFGTGLGAILFDPQTRRLWMADNPAGGLAYSENGISAPTTVAVGGGGLSNPMAMALDLDGKIWIANQGGKMTKLEPDGTLIGHYNTGRPWGVAADSFNRIWVTNSWDQRFTVMTP